MQTVAEDAKICCLQDAALSDTQILTLDNRARGGEDERRLRQSRHQTVSHQEKDVSIFLIQLRLVC